MKTQRGRCRNPISKAAGRLCSRDTAQSAESATKDDVFPHQVLPGTESLQDGHPANVLSVSSCSPDNRGPGINRDP